MSTRFGFEQLLSLLGRSDNDPAVRRFFGRELLNINNDEYYGSLEFKSEGVGVVFKERSWLAPPEKITDTKVICIAAFHLYSEGYEGFARYSGQLPDGVQLGDSEHSLIQKMGEPIRRGGGGVSPTLKRLVPRWFWFSLGEAVLHIQLDPNGYINLATLQTPEISV